ncbi:MAG TPA: 4Fe-4S dicluster domain-containing protein, partial [Polyangia bacterium]
SVLHDARSIVIGYDAARGEPRAPLRRTHLRVVEADGPAKSGDCIDCHKCAWTCPTGIDIRNGFQMECIACTQCIDVCDDVMDKIGRPRGLIRHAPLHAPLAPTAGGKAPRILRARLGIYGALAFIALAMFAVALWTRTPFEANVIRPVGVPWIVEGSHVRNQVEIHLVNKRPDLQRYQISVEAPSPLQAKIQTQNVTLPSFAHHRVPIVLLGARNAGTGPVAQIIVRESDTGIERRIPLRFLAPPSAF